MLKYLFGNMNPLFMFLQQKSSQIYAHKQLRGKISLSLHRQNIFFCDDGKKHTNLDFPSFLCSASRYERRDSRKTD